MGNIELIDNGSLLYELTEGYVFDSEDTRAIRYAPSLGFMALERGGNTYALGFHPTPQGWEGKPPERITPITDLENVPHEERTIDLQGKGVGPRLYSTRQCISGLAHPTPAGLYAVQISPGVDLLDIRNQADKTPTEKAGVARYAGRIGVKLRGLESAVNDIHQSYGQADLILLDRPADVARRQRSRGVEDIENADSTIIIVRDPDLELILVGHRILT